MHPGPPSSRCFRITLVATLAVLIGSGCKGAGDGGSLTGYVAELDCVFDRFFSTSRARLESFNNTARAQRADERTFLLGFVRTQEQLSTDLARDLAGLDPPRELRERHDDLVGSVEHTREYWRSLEPRVGKDPPDVLFAGLEEAEFPVSDRLDAVQELAEERGVISDLECDAAPTTPSPVP